MGAAWRRGLSWSVPRAGALRLCLRAVIVEYMRAPDDEADFKPPLTKSGQPCGQCKAPR